MTDKINVAELGIAHKIFAQRKERSNPMKSVKAEKAEKSAARRIHENQLEDDEICLRGATKYFHIDRWD